VLLSVLGLVAQRPAVSKAMVPAAALDESAATDLPEPTLTDRLAERLQDWHERVVRDAKRYAKIDDTARHRLRKRVKRLRYAAEFAAALFGRKAVQRYLKLLAPVQDSLGRYNDLCVGLAVYQGAVGDDPRAWFAIGWLTARRDVLLGESVAALKVIAGAEPFWKRG